MKGKKGLMVLGIGTALVGSFLLFRSPRWEPAWAKEVRKQVTTVRRETPVYPLQWQYIGQGSFYDWEEAVYIGWRTTPEISKDADAYMEIYREVGSAKASWLTVTGIYCITYFQGNLVPTVPMEVADIKW